MQVIGFCGYAGSGKDEAAKALVEDGWQRVSFADPIREMALAIDPIIGVQFIESTGRMGEIQRLSRIVEESSWNNAKQFSEVRRLLQRIGTEAGRDILGQDVWVNIGRDRALSCGKSVVFTDVRFPNEVAMIRELGGQIVRIYRPGVGPANGHSSETLIDSIEADATIHNSGSQEFLWSEARSAVAWLAAEKAVKP